MDLKRREHSGTLIYHPEWAVSRAKITFGKTRNGLCICICMFCAGFMDGYMMVNEIGDSKPL